MTNKFLRISNDFNVEFAKIIIFSQRTEAFFKWPSKNYFAGLLKGTSKDSTLLHLRAILRTEHNKTGKMAFK